MCHERSDTMIVHNFHHLGPKSPCSRDIKMVLLDKLVFARAYHKLIYLLMHGAIEPTVTAGARKGVWIEGHPIMLVDRNRNTTLVDMYKLIRINRKLRLSPWSGATSTSSISLTTRGLLGSLSLGGVTDKSITMCEEIV